MKNTDFNLTGRILTLKLPIMLFKRLITFILLIISISVSYGQSVTSNGDSVRIWEESIIIPTYLVDPPSISPQFFDGRSYQGAQGRVYPYPLNTSLTFNKVDEEYRMVYLENEFFKA
jgi:hypothetical protein